MPIISYTTIEGVLSENQKQQLGHYLTEAVGMVLGDKQKARTTITLHELKEGQYFVGGSALNARDINALVCCKKSID